MAGIEREQSTLNDQQFFTLAKTGLLNNLNLSQLIRSQNILDDDGIEDLHFYFVSFNQHKQRLLRTHETKTRKQSDIQQNQKSKPNLKNQKNKAKKEEDEEVRTIESNGPDDEYACWNE